jgi:hypothetical protein
MANALRDLDVDRGRPGIGYLAASLA